jgi:heptosyltransferase II
MKCLIIGPAWVGDMIMAQVVPLILSQLHPDIEIHMAAPASTLALAQRMPQIAQTHLIPFKHGQLDFWPRRAWSLEQKQHQFDQAIVLPNTWKSALLVYWSGIAKRTGWRGEYRYGLLNDCRQPQLAQYPLMVQRYAALAYPPTLALPEQLPKPSLQVNLVTQATLAAQYSYRPEQPLVVLCPGAEFGAAKRWPIEHFAELAQQMLAEGWQVWVMGSHKEQGLAAQITQSLLANKTADLSPPMGYQDLTGRTQLLEALDLLALADAVVSNDSGLLHMAAALNRPTVAIYGSSTSRFSPPLMAMQRMQIVEQNLNCRPCFQRECPLVHLYCLRSISAQRVRDAVRMVAR